MDLQKQFDVAVIIPTVLRPHLRWAVESVFKQNLNGRIQILIGVDKALGDRALLDQLIAEAPSHIHITVFDPGYSTSARHGGVYTSFYGGGLRTILTYMANSTYVAYLDDDDWFGPDHLSSLLTAIEGHDWAFSHRWYGHPSEPTGLCIDEWESVGPDAGVFKTNYGGFVAPSCMMMDKLRCHMLFPLWAAALYPSGDGEDRRIFSTLQEQGYRWASTRQATSYCTLDPKDGMHEHRLNWMRSRNATLPADWSIALNRYIGRS
jgi:hypothetical protein